MEKPRMTNTNVVRPCFEGYLTQGRDAAETLIDDDFVFTVRRTTTSIEQHASSAVFPS
jgi:ketosteroid isomerase-like protein